MPGTVAAVLRRPGTIPPIAIAPRPGLVDT